MPEIGAVALLKIRKRRMESDNWYIKPNKL